MILGTTLFRMGGNASYSPAFPKGGDSALFSVEVLNLIDSPTLVITVQHRNADETTYTDLASFTAITATGVHTKDVSGLKEIVRLKYAFSSADPIDGVQFIVAAPAWRPN
jgi:hypothetical protein